MNTHLLARMSAGLVIALVLDVAVPPSTWATNPRSDVGGSHDAERAHAEPSWSWPIDAPISVTRQYVAPAHAYAPGHRGIDVGASANTEVTVRAPDDGFVAFAGRVADRDVITIAHGGGLVSTLEPVIGTVEAGDRVAAGDPIGTLSLGGHASSGDLHLGARLDGDYVNPLLFLGGVPRAVLLPCC